MNTKNAESDTITEEILRKRLKKTESGALIPQIIVTVAVSFGSFSFGNILGWGGPAIHHLPELEYDIKKPDTDYAWVTSLAPLGAATGIIPCAFLNRRIGPKNTILVETPFLLIGWFLMAYYNHYKIYCSAHFVCAFFAVCYIYSGEMLLVETVHRNRMRTLFTFFRSSVILGILSMNIISTYLERLWLCTACASMTVICCMLTCLLPDSPVYLIQKSELAAENSLKYYTGKTSVGPELNVIRQYVNFLTFSSDTYKDMFSAKVVIKAILIVTTLQIIKTITGYYAFVLDSVRIFKKTLSVFNPYTDNIVFGAILWAAQFSGTLLHLHIAFGIKKPMMISTFLMTIILVGLGFVMHYEKDLVKYHLQWILLLGLCLFAVAYECGINICPRMALYDYVPYQIYDNLMKLMMIVHWFFVFGTVRVYAAAQFNLGLDVTLWILASFAFVGFIFISIFVVESKGKNLVKIQLELGGNPVGKRGSRRQRIANPLEDFVGFVDLQDIINQNQPTSTDQ